MRAHEELIERCARRRAERLGGLSDEGFEELRLAVAADVESFVDAPAERAFAILAAALDDYDAAREQDEDIFDEDSYLRARERRMEALRARCEEALEEDEGCEDARTIHDLLAPGGPEGVLRALESHLSPDAALGSWDDVFARPRLRAEAALARTRLEATRYRPALGACRRVLAALPHDELGARHTAALACVRLEDEHGFDELDARFAHQESAWTHLGRVLLMYKLDRPGAARRALHGYDRLVEGGAYALLRPVLVDPYLPDRPEAAPRSFEEAMLATCEAEPLVADVPTFVWWCHDQGWFVQSAHRFADERGYDWDE